MEPYPSKITIQKALPLPQRFQGPDFFISLLAHSVLYPISSIKHTRWFNVWSTKLANMALSAQRKDLFWQYFPHLPPDLDTTCLAALLLHRNKKLSPLTTFNILTALKHHKNSEEIFFTWIGVPKKQNEIDAVVNYNIHEFLKGIGYKKELQKSNAKPLYYGHEFYTALTNYHSKQIEFIYVDKNKKIQSPLIVKALRIRNRHSAVLRLIFKKKLKTRSLLNLKRKILLNLPIDQHSKKITHSLEQSHFISYGILYLWFKQVKKVEPEHLFSLCLSSSNLWLYYTMLNTAYDKKVPPALPDLNLRISLEESHLLNLISTSRDLASKILSTNRKYFTLDNNGHRKSLSGAIKVSYLKSIAQVVPLFFFCFNSSETKKLESFFRYYIFIKQIADDLHDINEDVLSNKSTVPTIILNKLSINHPDSAENITIRILLKQIRMAGIKSMVKYYEIPKHVRFPQWKREIKRIVRKAKQSERDYLFGKALLKIAKKTSGSIET